MPEIKVRIISQTVCYGKNENDEARQADISLTKRKAVDCLKKIFSFKPSVSLQIRTASWDTFNALKQRVADIKEAKAVSLDLPKVPGYDA